LASPPAEGAQEEGALERREETDYGSK